MPPLVATLLWKLIVPLVIEILKRTGAVNKAEALAAKVATKIAQAVGGTTVDPSYPSPPVSKSVGPSNGNYNKQEDHD